MKKFYIDVSKYQGGIDWLQVKAAGVQGAILRAGYGRYASQFDSTFERNYAACKRAGIPVGAYWYIYANTEKGIRAEMELFLQALTGKQMELPVYLDVEDKAQTGMNKAELTAMLRQGLAMLEAAGWFAGVYTYTAFAPRFDYRGIAAAHTMWLADYRANYDKTLPRDMHQYTSDGSVPGIVGRVDCNHCYRDFESEIKRKGRNGWQKTDEPGAQEGKEETAMEHTLKIGPVSGGDRAALHRLAQELALPCRDSGDHAVAGPMTQGDRAKIEAWAKTLGLAVQQEGAEEPVTLSAGFEQLRNMLQGLAASSERERALARLAECEMWALQAQ